MRRRWRGRLADQDRFAEASTVNREKEPKLKGEKQNVSDPVGLLWESGKLIHSDPFGLLGRSAHADKPLRVKFPYDAFTPFPIRWIAVQGRQDAVM